MPEKVESFEFRNFGSRTGESHDWDSLLDGGIYKCMEGVDFKVKKLTFMNAARKEAISRGLKLRTGSIDGGIVIQAIPGDTPGEKHSEANGTQAEPPKPVPPPANKPPVSSAAPKPATSGPAPKAGGTGPKSAARK